MDILTVILANARQLDPILLCNIACVSRLYESDVFIYWDKAVAHTRKVTCICEVCGIRSNAVLPLGMCRLCLAGRVGGAGGVGTVVSATQAKKEWYLKDEDLDELPVWVKRHSKYHTLMSLYLKKDVATKALVKHGGPGRLLAMREKSENRGLQIKVKRINDLMKHELYRRYPAPDYSLLCTDDFMKNGVGGIREVKKRVARWDQCEAAWKELSRDDQLLIDHVERMAMRSLFVVHGVPADVHAELARRVLKNQSRNKRQFELQAALESVGLVLRSDAKICWAFINGTGYGHDKNVEEIVDIMKEMDYLHKHTTYRKVLRELIEDRKDEIRFTYGWMPEDEFRELIDAAIPELSNQAKAIALRRKKSDGV